MNKGLVIVCSILNVLVIINCTGSSQIRSPNNATLQVKEFAFCEKVENRQPVGVRKSFSSNVGRVYFWTIIVGAEQPTTIKHVWYYENEKWLEIPLKIQYIRHRTWSYYTMRPDLTGKWHVEVVDKNGNVLGKFPIKIKD